MNWIKSIYLPVVIVIILFGIILYYLFNRTPLERTEALSASKGADSLQNLHYDKNIKYKI